MPYPLATPSPAQLARWRRLAFNTARVFPGGAGKRLGARTGGSIEFADYRGYTPGDDLRTVDWNLYARSDRMFVRTFRKEDEIKLDVLIDASASMGAPHPAKYRAAVGLGLALAWSALCAGHVVNLAVLRDGDCEAAPPATREAAFPGLLRLLRRREPDGRTRLLGSVEKFLAADPGRALVVLISDLLDPQAPRSVPAALAGRGHAVHVLHLLVPEEIRPEPSGPALLVDRETGATREVVLDEALADLCEQSLGVQLEAWRTAATRQGFYYRALNAEHPIEELVARLTGPLELLVPRSF